MILFFSGTGNSKYAAKRLAVLLNDTVADLFGSIRAGTPSKIVSDKPYIIVTPTYAWQIPRLVRDWFLASELSGAKEVYFVMTCGGSIAGAGKRNAELCQKKGLTYKGTAAVVMPENYIAMFSAPEKEKALAIVEKAEPVIDNIAAKIRAGETLPEGRALAGGLISGPLNRFFYAVTVKDEPFTVSSACVHCGLCQKLCPTANITVMDGKPHWYGNCTHCMACICHCPAKAIEYGSKSVGKPRYTCPKQ